MANVIGICGKICSGKSFYANKIKLTQNAVILSCDELTKYLFDNNLGEKHDEMIKRIKNYFLNKSLDFLSVNTNVILDWGFWSKEERCCIKEFFKKNNAKFELHYVKVDDSTWQKNIKERNEKILNDKNTSNYFLDEGLLNKLSTLWQEPTNDEIDVLYEVIR